MTLPQSIFRVALATVLVLLLPLAAMQFTPEVNWGLDDFIAAGLLLFGAGLAFVLIARLGDSVAYRLAVGVAVAAGLLLVWGNLAVGFLGSEDNPANLLYGGVLAVALIGAFAVRFRPLGLFKAMLATALTQFLVPVVAAVIWQPALDAGMAQVLVLNMLFAGLWVGAALLFRRASHPGANSNHQLA